MVMVVENPTFMDEQCAMYEFMHSSCAIRCEWWRLHVTEAESDALFEELAAEAIADGNAAHVDNSASFRQAATTTKPGRHVYRGPHLDGRRPRPRH